MKTSNKIIIAFAILIVSSMLTLFIDSKQHKKDILNNIEMKDMQLPLFSVVVAEKGADLHINQADSNMISIEYIKNKEIPAKLYTISGDTLYVYRGLRTFVKCKNLTTVIGNHPQWVGIFNFAPDSITLRTNGGKMVFKNIKVNPKNTNDNTTSFNVIAKDSAFLEIKSFRTKNVSVTSDNSEVSIYYSPQSVRVKQSNNARLKIENAINSLKIEQTADCKVDVFN